MDPMGFSRTPRWFGCFCSKFTKKLGSKSQQVWMECYGGYNSSYPFLTPCIGWSEITPSETHFFSSHSKKVPHFSKAPFRKKTILRSPVVPVVPNGRFSGLLQPWTSTRRLGGCWTQSRGTNGRAVTATWWCEAVSGWVGRDPGGHAWVFCLGGRIFRDFSRRMTSWKSVSEKLSYPTLI